MTTSTYQSPLKFLAVGLMTATLIGCSLSSSNSTDNGVNLVYNDNGVPNYYRVKSGDTVSQIANRYGMNYRDIGRINNLNSSYTIYAGQWLKLWSSKGGGSAPTQNNKYTGNTSTSTRTNNIYPNYSSSQLSFQYPTSNAVTRQYSGASNGLGMWFAGHQGDPVFASKSGTVIYVGDGLKEYGNLVMVRHNDDYVTAYAHNAQILVNEGQSVKQGQRIATMGSTGDTSQVGLEFQVRQAGKAIDPRRVLSK